MMIVSVINRLLMWSKQLKLSLPEGTNEVMLTLVTRL